MTNLREAFTISRELEYFSEPELTKQVGHSREWWPLVLLKELIDNSLDNCEEHGILPAVVVEVGDDAISVTDNGTGLDPDVVAGMLDFSNRVSSREAYRSLSRGAMGNAGKCMLAIPFVTQGHGTIEIEACGVRHSITVSVDPIAQKPIVEHHRDTSSVTNGTNIRVEFACKDAELEWGDFYTFIDSYCDLNPHLSMTCRLFGSEDHRRDRTSDQINKWSPRDADPAAWYDLESFERLLAAMITADRQTDSDRPLRDVLRSFAGLRGTAVQKSIASETGLSRAKLSALLNCKGFDRTKTEPLLNSMQSHGRVPKPIKLGCLGRDHVETVAKREGVSDLRYKKIAGVDSRGLPFVVEAAFGQFGEDDCDQVQTTGCNFSPAIGGAITRDIDYYLSEQYVHEYSPVLVLVHVATVAPNYLDRGKSVVDPDKVTDAAIEKAITSVTSDWKKCQHARIREENRQQKKKPAPTTKGVTLKDAIRSVIEQAVQDASGNGGYEFSDRELYYVARPLVQQYTSADLSQSYFDKVLDDWEVDHGLIEGRNRDPRGFLLEPHTGERIPLGTKEVDEYPIPLHLYGRILYCEKKNLVNKLADIGDRYDMAIMAAEGYAVRAGKALLQAAQNGHKMQVFCLHDADPHGYNIARTLSESSGAHQYDIEVVDIGLHLEEAIEMDLPTETFTRKKALPSEVEFTELELGLFGGTLGHYFKDGKQRKIWKGCQRVEINALSATPVRFLEWLENKLTEHGVTEKLVPPDDVLNSAIKGSRRNQLFAEVRDKVQSHLRVNEIVGDVVAGVIDSIGIASINGQVRDWAATLTADHWEQKVDHLVMDAIDQARDEITNEVSRQVKQ